MLADAGELPPTWKMSASQHSDVLDAFEYFEKHPTENCIKPLVNCFCDDHDEVFFIPRSILEHLPRRKVKPELLEAIEQGMPGPRRWATLILMRESSPENADDCELFLRLLKDKQQSVREYAITAIERIGSKAAIPSLKERLRSTRRSTERKFLQDAIDLLEAS